MNPHPFPLRAMAVGTVLGLALCAGANAQIPGDAPGGAPQFRDATGVLQPGSGAAGTTGTNSGTWTPKPLRRDTVEQAPPASGPVSAQPASASARKKAEITSAASAPAKVAPAAKAKPR
ncbi:MAG: hypothetical protein WAQ08_04085 [Aquabacterium sp.]|jgi:hypothetical protein|uniref:hypothetical protein n=1 Tax=Aquabacterium sp. TaxID=1872578 RepID=UPI003BB031B6